MKYIFCYLILQVFVECHHSWNFPEHLPLKVDYFFCYVTTLQNSYYMPYSMVIMFICLMHWLVLIVYVFLMCKILSDLVTVTMYGWMRQEGRIWEGAEKHKKSPFLPVTEPWIMNVVLLPPKYVYNAVVIENEFIWKLYWILVVFHHYFLSKTKTSYRLLFFQQIFWKACYWHIM